MSLDHVILKLVREGDFEVVNLSQENCLQLISTMILTVDRKHLILCSSIILVSNGTSIFLREKVSETKDFIEKANGGKEP